MDQEKKIAKKKFCGTCHLFQRNKLDISLNSHLRKIIETDYTRGRRKLHKEELRDLYSLPNIVRVVKSRRMRWAGHVARMGRGEVCTGF